MFKNETKDETFFRLTQYKNQYTKPIYSQLLIIKRQINHRSHRILKYNTSNELKIYI